MTPLPESFAAAAEALVGAPYRLHGRSREHGLDCIGLVACALAACGAKPRAPAGYGLRNSTIDAHLHRAALNGFAPASGPVLRGDLVLVVPGPAQHHLLVATGGGGFVHAHAGLRRVIRDNGLPGAPVLGHWRLTPPE